VAFGFLGRTFFDADTNRRNKTEILAILAIREHAKSIA
jgi:hypothetical protein